MRRGLDRRARRDAAEGGLRLCPLLFVHRLDAGEQLGRTDVVQCDELADGVLEPGPTVASPIDESRANRVEFVFVVHVVRLARETQLLRFLRVGDRPSAIRQRGNEVVEAMGADAMACLPALGRLVGCDPHAVDAVFTAPSAPDRHVFHRRGLQFDANIVPPLSATG